MLTDTSCYSGVSEADGEDDAGAVVINPNVMSIACWLRNTVSRSHSGDISVGGK